MTKPSEDPYINLTSAHREHTCIVGATPSAHPMPVGKNRTRESRPEKGFHVRELGFRVTFKMFDVVT